MARPVWTPTDAQRRQAETMAAYGIPEADIARVLGVSKPTLRKQPYCEGLRHGIDRGYAFPSSTIYDGALPAPGQQPDFVRPGHRIAGPSA